MKTTQLFRLISIINSLFIIPACSAQNPSQSLIEDIFEEILQERECFSLKDLAVNGNDVKKTMNLKEGKDVGYWLNEILKKVIDGELKNNRDDLIYWMTGIADGWIKL